MAREQERDPERREAAVRASGEEEEAAGEEGLSDSDEGDGVETGSGREEGEQEAAAGWERSEDVRLLRAGLPPAAVPTAAARDPSGRRPPGTPPGRPRMPPPGDQDRARRRSRRRRRDLLLSQLCFLASVALLLWSLSSLREQKAWLVVAVATGRNPFMAKASNKVVLTAISTCAGYGCKDRKSEPPDLTVSSGIIPEDITPMDKG